MIAKLKPLIHNQTSCLRENEKRFEKLIDFKDKLTLGDDRKIAKLQTFSDIVEILKKT